MRSKISCDCGPVPVTVSPVTSPWSATASMVFSGMVLTVLGATSSVTYSVSGSDGSFTPVEAQSGRWGRAPCSSMLWKRAPTSNTCW